MSESERQLITRPAWLRRLETFVGLRVPLHPNVLSAAKLVVITPLLLCCLAARDPRWTLVIMGLFVAFGVLDYLDGVVARERGLANGFGRIFDRVTDYPLIIGVSFFCLDVIPASLLVPKVGLDLLLLVLFLLDRGSTQNRLRTAMSYTTLMLLMAFSQGWLSAVISAGTVQVMLAINIAFSSVVVLYNLDLLQKKHVANALSFGNLVCGLLAIGFAARGLPVVSLGLLLTGLTFDGFDGAAARRWGSTRWGVYSDDVADGVNFALAPAAVLWFTIGGVPGAVLAGLFATCTIGRLVFFTLDKDAGDPGYFRGAPSPVGGLIATCAAILFVNQPAVVGLCVGIACAQMTSFATAYRHLGRLAGSQPRLLVAIPIALAALVASFISWGPAGPTAGLLAVALAYTTWPKIRAFATVGTPQRATG